MSIATISSKGQLTIPREIRESLDLKQGDRVMVVVEGNHIVLQPLIRTRRSILELQGAFAGRRPFPGREVEREAAEREAVREALGLPEE